MWEKAKKKYLTGSSRCRLDNRYFIANFSKLTSFLNRDFPLCLLLHQLMQWYASFYKTNVCKTNVCLIKYLDLYHFIKCLQEGRPDSSSRFGSENCWKIWEESQKGSSDVWGMQSAAVSFLKKKWIRRRINSTKLIFASLYYLSRRLPFTPDQDISEADWEVYLRETANAIVSQQTPQR